MKMAFAEELAFVVERSRQDEASVLAQAVREGIHSLYREALIKAYLADELPRDEALRILGSDTLEEIEYQRDAFRRDVAWGISGG
jgi:hypothetical protein